MGVWMRAYVHGVDGFVWSGGKKSVERARGRVTTTWCRHGTFELSARRLSCSPIQAVVAAVFCHGSLRG